MSWSSRHQLRYTLILILSLGSIIAYTIYNVWFSDAPTCFDQQLNGNEEGVDCGGSCYLLCPVATPRISELWEVPVRVVDGVYSAVAYVQNTSLDAATDWIQYEVKLYDDNFVLLHEPIVRSEYLGPNERAALIVTGIQTGKQVPVRASFRITNQPRWYHVNERVNPSPIVTISRRLDTHTTDAPRVTAVLENPTFEDFQDIQVQALVYDADQNLVGVSSTLVERIASLDQAQAVFTWPEPFVEPAVAIEIIPRINPFAQPGWITPKVPL